MIILVKNYVNGMEYSHHQHHIPEKEYYSELANGAETKSGSIDLHEKVFVDNENTFDS